MGESVYGRLPPSDNGIDLPKIKPIRLGEYGKVLEQVWKIFAKARRDGFYAGDENQDAPRFSEAFATSMYKK